MKTNYSENQIVVCVANPNNDPNLRVDVVYMVKSCDYKFLDDGSPYLLYGLLDLKTGEIFYSCDYFKYVCELEEFVGVIAIWGLIFDDDRVYRGDFTELSNYYLLEYDGGFETTLIQVRVANGQVKPTEDSGVADCIEEEFMEDTPMTSNVDHPPHYNQGKYEVIDVVEDSINQLEGDIAFSIGNALKYILRFQHKGNGVEDLKKAIWYTERAIGLLEKFE